MNKYTKKSELNFLEKPKKKEIPLFENLFTDINNLKCVLNDEATSYLLGLINLDYSILHDDNKYILISHYLKELELFKQIVLYNIYYKATSFASKNNKRYKIYYLAEYNYLYIDSKQTHNSVLDFDFNKDIPNIHLYHEVISTYTEKRKIIKDKLTQKRALLEEYMKKTNINLKQKNYSNDTLTEWFDAIIPDYVSVQSQSKLEETINILKYEIKELSSITDEDLEKEYLKSIERNNFTDNFLKQNNLDLDTDFELYNSQNNQTMKVKKYGFANVIIRG